jgi:hypothetical protein
VNQAILKEKMWCLYTEDQEGVDFDDYELSNIKENALP